jgi:hypothetical protein
VEKAREYCVKAYARYRKKCRFLAADKWIKREWPNIVSKYSPEGICNAEEPGNVFVLSLSIHICLKMKVLKASDSSFLC